MRRSLRLTVLAGVLALSAGPAAEASHHRGGDLGADVALRPLAGHAAKGVVHFSALRDEPTRTRGVLIGLLLPAVDRVQLALSHEPCATVDERGGSRLHRIGEPLDVAPDGTALLEQEGIFYGFELRRARSLVLVGTGTPDAGPVPLGCGPLATYSKVRDMAAEDTGTLNAVRTAGGDVSGAPAFLAGLVAREDGTGEAAAAFAGLERDTGHGLAVSPSTCEEHGAGAGVLGMPVVTFVTDRWGSAQVSVAADDSVLNGARNARSLLVTRPGPQGLVIVVCARAGTARVDERP